jgi:glutaredoxin
MRTVQVYSRQHCHLCETAVETLKVLQRELEFEIVVIHIDGDKVLEDLYGEQVPVIQIDGVQHDFFRVNPERFKNSFNQSL